MDNSTLYLLLADDDLDDCEFFKEALNEIESQATLTTVNDGVQLMNNLTSEEKVNYPDIIFLDLNMPRKSGMECLKELKAIEELRHIPIVIYSTSLDMEIVNQLYEMGAHYYIQKPGSFAILKKVIKRALSLFSNENSQPLHRESFVIQP